VLALVAVVVTAGPAAAGGSWLSPVRDRYEPGELVTLVGYVGPGGTLGSVDDGPFFAYLHHLEAPLSAPNDLPIAPFAPQPSDLRLGQLVVEQTGQAGYTAYRASIKFPLPGDLRIGRYGVSYCNASCTKGLSDLIGGVIFVGTEPDGPIGRTWPLDEPEVANLADSALLHGPGWQITALEARAGLRPDTPAATIPAEPPSSQATANRARHRAVSDASTSDKSWPAWALLTVVVTGVIGVGGLAAYSRSRSR
jgi:hypothetical protein